jgi:hypothetical protein
MNSYRKASIALAGIVCTATLSLGPAFGTSNADSLEAKSDINPEYSQDENEQVPSLILKRDPLPRELHATSDFFAYVYTGFSGGIIFDQESREIHKTVPLAKVNFEATAAQKSMLRQQTIRLQQETKKPIRYVIGQLDKLEHNFERLKGWIPIMINYLESNSVSADAFGLFVTESALDKDAVSNMARISERAVGIGQFQKGTGRNFMMINNSVDERLDPAYSSRAAARLLVANYARYGLEELALGSYHSGIGNYDKALAYSQHMLGGAATRDDILLQIFLRYALEPKEIRGSFGPESRSYIAKARGVGEKFAEQFLNNEIQALEYDTVTLLYNGRTRLTITDVARTAGARLEDLKVLNPGLLYLRRSEAFLSRFMTVQQRNAISQEIPQGYGLRLPSGLADKLSLKIPDEIATMKISYQRSPPASHPSSLQHSRQNTVADKAFQELADKRRQLGVDSITRQELLHVRLLYNVEMLGLNNLDERRDYVEGRLQIMDYKLKSFDADQATKYSNLDRFKSIVSALPKIHAP